MSKLPTPTEKITKACRKQVLSVAARLSYIPNPLEWLQQKVDLDLPVLILGPEGARPLHVGEDGVGTIEIGFCFDRMTKIGSGPTCLERGEADEAFHNIAADLSGS